MNADRKREREALLQALVPHVGHLLTEEALTYMVDDLLDRWGVIAPPCRVGDTVYFSWPRGYVTEDEVTRLEYSISGLEIHALNSEFLPAHIGDFIFLTHEEAERDLQARNKRWQARTRRNVGALKEREANA